MVFAFLMLRLTLSANTDIHFNFTVLLWSLRCQISTDGSPSSSLGCACSNRFEMSIKEGTLCSR